MAVCCSKKSPFGMTYKAKNQPTILIERTKKIRPELSLSLEVVGLLFEKF